MIVSLTVELLEPAVAEAIGPREFAASLNKALRRYRERYGIRLEPRISFEPIRGEIRRFVARSGEKRLSVRAILPGKATVQAEIDPGLALALADPRGPLRFFRRVCHEARVRLKGLGKGSLPCELANFFVGRLTPLEGLRIRRDHKGFRHVFGAARISIRLRIFPLRGIMESPSPLDTVRYIPEERAVRLINQRRLPDSVEYFTAKTVEDVAYAIKNMVVRGAPAIGITAAYGMKLFAETYSGKDFESDARRAIELLRRTRPTGKNLFRALKRISGVVDRGPEAVSAAADEVVEEEKRYEKLIADHSLKFVELLSEKLGKKEITFHTHCNAGRLATYGLFGTATAPIYVAHRNGYRVRAIADETRPVLQGARLTARELSIAGIDTTVIPDTAIGLVLMKRLSDVIVVGADRVCKDRSVVNKIGTYVLATLAKRHGIPFVVVAPTSTFDECSFEDPPPIEERDESEVRYIRDVKIVPDGARVLNYAFDITPADLVNYVISERGIHEVNPI